MLRGSSNTTKPATVLCALAVLALVAGCQSASKSPLLPISKLAGTDESKAAAGGPLELKSADDFNQQVASGLTPTLVTYYSPSSAASVMVNPVVDKMAAMFAGKVKIVKVNVDEQAGLAKGNNVAQSPTFAGYVGGKELKRLVGPQPPEAIKGLIESLLAKK